jgi:hypothetical protein
MRPPVPERSAPLADGQGQERPASRLLRGEIDASHLKHQGEGRLAGLVPVIDVIPISPVLHGDVSGRWWIVSLAGASASSASPPANTMTDWSRAGHLGITRPTHELPELALKLRRDLKETRMSRGIACALYLLSFQSQYGPRKSAEGAGASDRITRIVSVIPT